MGQSSQEMDDRLAPNEIEDSLETLIKESHILEKETFELSPGSEKKASEARYCLRTEIDQFLRLVMPFRSATEESRAPDVTAMSAATEFLELDLVTGFKAKSRDDLIRFEDKVEEVEDLGMSDRNISQTLLDSWEPWLHRHVNPPLRRCIGKLVRDTGRANHGLGVVLPVHAVSDTYDSKCTVQRLNAVFAAEVANAESGICLLAGHSPFEVFLSESYDLALQFTSHISDAARLCPADLQSGSSHECGFLICLHVLRYGNNINQQLSAFEHKQLADLKEIAEAIAAAGTGEQLRRVYFTHRAKSLYQGSWTFTKVHKLPDLPAFYEVERKGIGSMEARGREPTTAPCPTADELKARIRERVKQAIAIAEKRITDRTDLIIRTHGNPEKQRKALKTDEHLAEHTDVKIRREAYGKKVTEKLLFMSKKKLEALLKEVEDVYPNLEEIDLQEQ